MTIRLLISARDPGAAFHIIEVVKQVVTDPRYVVKVVAQSPAAEFFDRAGIYYERVNHPKANIADSFEGLVLLDEARRIIKEFQPSRILCGLSTPFDGGIDEALLSEAECPTFLFQDFWGEQNTFFGKGAGCFFVLDEQAVMISHERHGVDSVIVGSPRHQAYAEYDIPKIRERIRKKVLGEKELIIIGFFGQALHKLKGYERTMQEWVKSISKMDTPLVVIYRPHPRESIADRMISKNIMDASGIKYITLDEEKVEDVLICCDVVCSAFSNCTYDMAFLNYFSDSAVATPVSLFFDSEIIDYFRNIVNLQEFPYLKDGLVLAVDCVSELKSCLANAAKQETKESYWRMAKKKLPNPIRSVDTILNYMANE